MRVTALRRVSLAAPNRLPLSAAEMRRVVRAIKRRDGGSAYEASLKHVHQAARAALAKLDEA